MTKQGVYSLSLGLALAMSGCEKPVERSEPEQIAQREQATEPAPAPAPKDSATVAPTAETLPIPEDFADEAEKEITKSNYVEALASMESELAP